MTGIDEVIHQPVRLRIMSSLVALDAGDQVDFSTLRKLLKVTDGNLGAHLTKLESVHYVEMEKTFVDKKPKTYVRITGKGRDAFGEHINALKEIIEGTKSM